MDNNLLRFSVESSEGVVKNYDLASSVQNSGNGLPKVSMSGGGGTG